MDAADLSAAAVLINQSGLETNAEFRERLVAVLAERGFPMM